jgi:hypothetical protein
MRYSDVKEDLNLVAKLSLDYEETERLKLRVLHAICGELSSIAYHLGRRQKHASKDKANN